MKVLRNSSAVLGKYSSWQNIKEKAYVARMLRDI